MAKKKSLLDLLFKGRKAQAAAPPTAPPTAPPAGGGEAPPANKDVVRPRIKLNPNHPLGKAILKRKAAMKKQMEGLQ